jgi:periplasmic protein TonB
MRAQAYRGKGLLGDGILNGVALSVLFHMTAFFLMVIVPFMLPSRQIPLPLCMVDLLVLDMAGDAGGGEAGAMRQGDGKPEPTCPPEMTDPPPEPEPVAESEPEKPDAVYLSELIEPPETPPPIEKKIEQPKDKPKPKPKPQPKPVRVEKPAPRPDTTASNRLRPETDKPGTPEGPGGDHGKGIGTENGSGTGLADSGTGHGTGPGSGSGLGFGHGPMEASFGSGNGPRFATKALPKYPRLARELGKEGTVLLRLTIDDRGRLLDVEVLKRAGSGFDEEAVRAVRDSSFSPAKINGRPVSCRAQLPIRFVLNSAEKD